MKFLLMSGSLRADSLNKKLLQNIASIIQEKNLGVVEIIDLKNLQIPLYDGDIEKNGIPEGVQKLATAISGADVFISSSPEYNGSMSAPLKNAIDWVSRLKPMPWAGKPILLTGASPGGFGAVRGLAHSRTPFESVGSYLYPQTFGLARAHEAFDGEGKLLDQQTKKRLEDLLNDFSSFSAKLK